MKSLTTKSFNYYYISTLIVKNPSSLQFSLKSLTSLDGSAIDAIDAFGTTQQRWELYGVLLPQSRAGPYDRNQ